MDQNKDSSPWKNVQQFEAPTPQTCNGRSVREFDEQISSLRSENFNLKLRLYLIEESMNQGDGQESLLKQSIDMKVDIEHLRKELHDKQDLLKDAAMAFNQMESLQKETETKHQGIVDDLNQRIEHLEIEKGIAKRQSDECINRSNMTGTVNDLQKIRELEGYVQQSDNAITELNDQISNLNKMLLKRDETIKEYEDKVKDIVFQNSELLEVLETKESDIQKIHRNNRHLLQMNANLKEDKIHLISAANFSQEDFRKQTIQMKTCEHKLREQQAVMKSIESTLATKTINTKRLLDRIEECEKMVTKINFERNIATRENRFYRSIISKLQQRRNPHVTGEKAEIFQHISATGTTNTSAPSIENKIISHDKIAPTVWQQNKPHAATYQHNQNQYQQQRNHYEHNRQQRLNIPNVQEPPLQADDNGQNDRGHSHDNSYRQPHDHHHMPHLNQPLPQLYHQQSQNPRYHSGAHERDIYGDPFDDCNQHQFHYDEVKARGDYQAGDSSNQPPRNMLHADPKQSVNYHNKNPNHMASPSTSRTPAVAMAADCGTSSRLVSYSSELSINNEQMVKKLVRNGNPCAICGYVDDSTSYTISNSSLTHSSDRNGNDHSESTSFFNKNRTHSEEFLNKDSSVAGGAMPNRTRVENPRFLTSAFKNYQ